MKKFVEDQELTPDVTLVGRTAILHDLVVPLDGIGDMYRALLKQISDEEYRITQGLSDTDDRFQLRLPEFPNDEPNNTHVDFFFAELPRNGFVGAGDIMLDVLAHHESFRNRYFFDTGNGNLSFRPEPCFELLERFARLRALLFSAIHFSSGSPARGSEILSQSLRNQPGGDVRNVQLIDGKICFVGGYNKTTHQVWDLSRADQSSTVADRMDSQTEKHKVMYRFPPDDLAPYLLREWLLYRPLQVYIARFLDKPDTAHRLRYLLVPGLYRPLESGDITDMLRASTMKHLGCEVGLRDWREIESSFMRRFCDRVGATFVPPAHYQQRGHSLRTGVEYYGRTLDSPRVPEQMIQSHLDTSRFWQDLTSKSRRLISGTQFSLPSRCSDPEIPTTETRSPRIS